MTVAGRKQQGREATGGTMRAQEMFDLSGKVAAVTGAASGLGLLWTTYVGQGKGLVDTRGSRRIGSQAAA